MKSYASPFSGYKWYYTNILLTSHVSEEVLMEAQFGDFSLRGRFIYRLLSTTLHLAMATTL